MNSDNRNMALQKTNAGKIIRNQGLHMIGVEITGELLPTTQRPCAGGAGPSGSKAAGSESPCAAARRRSESPCAAAGSESPCATAAQPAPPVAAGPRQIQVCSMGVGIHKSMEVRQQKWEGEETIARLLQAEYSAHGAVPVFVDCRIFHDPDRPRGVNHIGLHPVNIERFVFHTRFEGWLQQTRGRILEAIAGATEAQAPTVAVVCYCQKGRHRSVSAATVISHCLRTEPAVGNATVLVAHKAADEWHRGTCDGCQECRKPSNKRDGALEVGRRVWVAQDGMKWG